MTPQQIRLLAASNIMGGLLANGSLLNSMVADEALGLLSELEGRLAEQEASDEECERTNDPQPPNFPSPLP